MAQDSVQHVDPQFSGSGSNPESGKHIALALIIAAVIVFGARLLADQFARKPAAPATAISTTTAPPDNASDVVDEQVAAQARKERLAREQAAIEQERARREQKKADVMRARDEAVAASQAEDARKEAAWQRFFTRSKKCDTASDDATRVDCSNQYIRAKERFDKLYAEGKLH